MQWLTACFIVSTLFHGSAGSDEQDLCQALRSMSSDLSGVELYKLLACRSLLSSCGTNLSNSCPFPWVVSVREKATREHVCVGTLLDERHVLTAANCFNKGKMSARQVEIGLGSSQTGYFKYLNVKKIKVHPNFTWNGSENDIAILTLINKVEMSLCIQPICLPSFSQYPSSPEATVAGWGFSKSFPQERRLRPTSLQITPMRILKDNICQFNFPEIFNWDYRTCSESWDTGDYTCGGYTGAPLMVKYGGKWFIHAISSKKEECQSQSLFTTIPYFVKWISDRISR